MVTQKDKSIAAIKRETMVIENEMITRPLVQYTDNDVQVIIASVVSDTLHTGLVIF